MNTIRMTSADLRRKESIFAVPSVVCVRTATSGVRENNAAA